MCFVSRLRSHLCADFPMQTTLSQIHPKHASDDAFQQLLTDTFIPPAAQDVVDVPGQDPAFNPPPASPRLSAANNAGSAEDFKQSETAHFTAEPAALPASQRSASGTGNGGSSEMERESGKSQKSSGNPAVQVSRQIYTEFKDHVAGSRLLGTDKGWPLGKLLQMATKQMQDYMEVSQAQHLNVMEKFAMFQRVRQQDGHLNSINMLTSAINLCPNVCCFI